MAQYKGFSTVNRNKRYRLTDFELAKQDLYNNFNIRRGEKLMNPAYGTIIHDMVFEPFDADTKNKILNDINKIIGSDPRIAAENVSVIQAEQGFQVELDLIYIKTNERDTLKIEYNRSIGLNAA
jgi:phage baseplate assembly protein W